MLGPADSSFVRTIKERCRVCYTCVRECPAKAIRISDGQAEIVDERCINCGNCVKVCSQGAKQVVSTIEPVETLLKSKAKVSACIAPSFPGEFIDISPDKLVGMIRKLGFDIVNEVAFGADLVAKKYRELLAADDDGKRYISTPCPAIVTYVERYHPQLADHLVPVVSPMVAMARALRLMHDSDLKVVFIGPCIAKKQEAASTLLDGEIDAVLTFRELREMFDQARLSPESVDATDFDPPHGQLGTVFPLSRGLLQAANVSEDLISGEIITTDGRQHFMEALREFGSGDLDAKLLEILCCNGCIMGPGMSTAQPQFARRSNVSQYARERLPHLNKAQWQRYMDQCRKLDLSRTFVSQDRRIPAPSEEELATILARMGKVSSEDELNCGACGYDSCREHAIAIHKGLAESEMCLPYTIDQLNRMIGELAVSNEQLASVQETLVQAEKMASMGQLAAGIAHEINNPLGVVLMYAHLLLDELQGDDVRREDLTLIADQADRCKKIVSGLLHFARQNKIVLRKTDLTRLVADSLGAMHFPGNINVKTEDDGSDTTAEIDHDQIVQVLTNLVSNAQAAMPQGGTLTVRTATADDQVQLAVSDTGVGIGKDNIDKIFEPFFTTKQIGKGTGLGLAVTYGVVKMHRGDIEVESNADPAAGPTGTTFTVTLPKKGRHQAPAAMEENES